MASADSSLKATADGCDWPGCKAPFYAAYNDVTVIPEFKREPVTVGRVCLCYEHMRVFVRDRWLRLDWSRVL